MSASQPSQTPLSAVARDLATYGVMSALSQASGLLLLPILTRALSVDAYGSVDMVAAFVAFLTMLFRAALPSAVARDYHSSENSEGPARLVSTLLAFVAGVGALAAAGLSAFAEPLARWIFDDPGSAAYLKLGCGIAWFSALVSIPYMALRMQRRIVAYNALRMLQTLAYVGLTVALVIGRERGVRGVFEAQLLTHAGVLACALFLIRAQLTPRLSLARLRAGLGFSLPMLPGRIAVVINEQADRVLLLAFVGLGGVGQLGVAARVASAVQFALVVFRQAWQPHAMLLIDAPRRNDTYRRMLNYYAGTFSILGLWLSAIGPEIFRFVVPPEYAEGYQALPWLIGAAILHQSVVITTLGPIVKRQTSSLSSAALIGMLLNVALALALIPRLGLGGAAMGLFASTLVYTGLLWRRSVYDAGIPFDGATAIAAVATYVLASLALLTVWREFDGVASCVARAGIALAATVFLVPHTLDAQAWNLLRKLARRAVS
ncbi:MAG: lipopolysaccharide biosynthesis protein [Deltaproteobacteria bacterium]|nr:lipopolysaccharide biosynthesis protein [Deltaproteobacteria bacterium]MBW2359593.1 lipopolysaccharide biosynthesis protein [Deltaproteobacteria bacterium]